MSAIKNFTIVFNRNAGTANSLDQTLFCEFDPDEVIITDYSTVVTAPETVVPPGNICVVSCDQFTTDQNRLFSFPLTCTRIFDPTGVPGFRNEPTSRTQYLDKRIPISGMKINGAYRFRFLTQAGESINGDARFVLVFNLSFRKYKRAPLGVTPARPAAPDDGIYFM